MLKWSMLIVKPSRSCQRTVGRNFANGRADIEALLVSVASDDNPFAKPKKKSGTVRVKKARLIVGSRQCGADDAKLTPKQAAKIRAEFNERWREAYEAN
jgi:hypothetical protein